MRLNKLRTLQLVDENIFLQNIKRERQNPSKKSTNLKKKQQRLQKVREAFMQIIQENYSAPSNKLELKQVKEVFGNGSLLSSQFSGVIGLSRFHNSYVYIYGGVGSETKDSLIKLNISKRSVRKFKPWEEWGIPFSRYGHSMHQLDSKRMIVFGGEMTSNDSNVAMSQIKMHQSMGCFILNSHTRNIQQVFDKYNRGPVPRKYHSSCVVGRRFLIVFAGFKVQIQFSRLDNSSSFLDDFWVYDLVKRKWVQMELAFRNRDLFHSGLIFHSLVTTYHYALDKMACVKGKVD